MKSMRRIRPTSITLFSSLAPNPCFRTRPFHTTPVSEKKKEPKGPPGSPFGEPPRPPFQSHPSTTDHDYNPFRRAELPVPAKYVSKLSTALRGVESSGDQNHASATPEKAVDDTSPPPYSRRIEGLLDASSEIKPVLEDVIYDGDAKEVPLLEHGLERVLFNPGVHWVQDPRSRVYNFTPYIQEVPTVDEFAFDRIGEYISSSKDDALTSLAKEHNKKFVGSTSSLTGVLSHIYFLISGKKNIDISSLSKGFSPSFEDYSFSARMPVTVGLKLKDGVYAFDSSGGGGEGDADKNILMWLGTLLERFLTLRRGEFSRYLRSSDDPMPMVDQRREAYRYSKSSKFVMRSQLDCRDPRLPGSGVFDIKTRGAVSVRLDNLNYQESSGYLIRTLRGPLESFEKEYYDLMRSAFLKYNFQARIGNMDGVFVAYHNVARIFGFQYIPLVEMDECLFGSQDAGERVFRKCVELLEILLDEIIACFPNESVKLTFETVTADEMMVWVQPAAIRDTKKPIVQLSVTVKNYLSKSENRDGRLVQPAQAFTSKRPWTIHWTISRSSLPQEAIYGNLNDARERQFRAYSLLDDTSPEDMLDMYDNINFGAEGTDEALASTSPRNGNGGNGNVASKVDAKKLFKPPTQYVRALRELSRSGRQDLARWEEKEKGMQKVLWTPIDSSADQLQGLWPSDAPPRHSANVAEDAETDVDVAITSDGPMEGDGSATPQRTIEENGPVRRLHDYFQSQIALRNATMAEMQPEGVAPSESHAAEDKRCQDTPEALGDALPGQVTSSAAADAASYVGRQDRVIQDLLDPSERQT